MRNPHKALEAIERLVGGDFGLDMEMVLYDKNARKNVISRLKAAARVITDIYIIAHAENSKGCKHENWEEKKYKILAEPEV